VRLLTALSGPPEVHWMLVQHVQVPVPVRRRPMRATTGTGFVLILGCGLAACGGGSSPAAPSTSLSALGRLAIAQVRPA